MTPQEIFDTVATHLFTQGRRSMHNGICVYRGENNLKCAVGILIPDSVYTPWMDSKSPYGLDVYSLIRKFHKELPVWFGQNKALLLDLQEVHDAEDNWQKSVRMQESLQNIAKHYDLNPSILSTLSFSNR